MYFFFFLGGFNLNRGWVLSYFVLVHFSKKNIFLFYLWSFCMWERKKNYFNRDVLQNREWEIGCWLKSEYLDLVIFWRENLDNKIKIQNREWMLLWFNACVMLQRNEEIFFKIPFIPLHSFGIFFSQTVLGVVCYILINKLS